jgi:hypothetical protein
MKPSRLESILFSLFGATLLSGCFPNPDNEGDVYRTALPVQESVTLTGPETSAAATAQTSSNDTEAPADAPYSKYYVFTRGVRNGVNLVTSQVLGTVWFVVNTKPTSIEDNQATWGPYSDPLEPATWRFRVIRVADEQYSYLLEGRPRESTSDKDYLTVLDGIGYGLDDERHGDGTFSIDLDAARTLDPFTHRDDSGTITVTHDLPRTVSREVAPLPRRIEVVLAPTASASRLEILSLARADTTGLLLVDGTADIDDSHATMLEDVSIASQWNAIGAGRADVTIAGGDVPEALSPVRAVECWDRHYKQSYYHDSAGIDPTRGDLALCAFSAPATEQ